VARTVKWTEAALTDLAETADFIARDSPFYAASLVREVRTASLTLRNFAHRGRVVPECDSPEIREIFIKSWRLIYQITDDHVFILAFVHGARDLSALWKRRP